MNIKTAKNYKLALWQQKANDGNKAFRAVGLLLRKAAQLLYLLYKSWRH